MNKFEIEYNKIINESNTDISNLTEDQIKRKLINIDEKIADLKAQYNGFPPISELDDLTKQARFLNKQLARLKSGFNPNPSETELQKVYDYEIFIEHIKDDMQNILNRLESEIINFKQNKFNFSKANLVYQKMKNIEKKLKESIIEF